MSRHNYCLQPAGSWIDRLAVKKRVDMYELFLREIAPTHKDMIADVGVTADKRALSSNFFEKFYPHKQNIIAISNQNADFLQDIYPGLRFQLGDALDLPFENNSVDFVFSSAVIEHIGCEKNQQQLLAECYRVARKAIFITTPNRWHPVDAHTLLPFLHWLPKKLHRSLLKIIGLRFYSQEENLNLMDKKSLLQLCHQNSILNPRVLEIKTFGITSNLVLVARKTKPQNAT